ncbi:MAG: 3-deoxy-D-manno-octulosonic acid transferase [Planctomycetota bacterium]
MTKTGRGGSTRHGNPAAFTVFDTLYAAAGAAAAAITIPYGYIKTRNDAVARARFSGRLGKIDITRKIDIIEGSAEPRIQFHGVSVGEVKLIAPLLREIGRENIKIEPVITSTTPAGLAEAQRLFMNSQFAAFPVDYPTCPKRFLTKARPSGIVLMEWEAWPLFLRSAASLQIPVAIVNGRISQKTENRYRYVLEFARRRLGAISLFAMQNEEYAQRLERLGVPKDKITITGNMKFDAAIDPAAPRDCELARLLQLDGRAPVVAGGSTHAPEEEILARAIVNLRKREGMQQLRLMIVPRHLDRVAEIVSKVASIAGGCERLTALRAESRVITNPAVPVVIDTIGDLEKIYRFANVAFVGGSLQNDRGGQNMLEPAALGAPVVHGTSVPNFAEAAEILRIAGGAIAVRDAAELETAIARVLGDAAFAKLMIENAKKSLEPHRGASKRTVLALRNAGVLV